VLFVRRGLFLLVSVRVVWRIVREEHSQGLNGDDATVDGKNQRVLFETNIPKVRAYTS
jgi:hypothetical protein